MSELLVRLAHSPAVRDAIFVAALVVPALAAIAIDRRVRRPRRRRRA